MELDKLIEKFREQQPESVMSYEEPSVNKFDAPIPGQSLTDEPGNYPWEHPPKTASIEEAMDFVYESMMKEENMELYVCMMWKPVKNKTRRRNIRISSTDRQVSFPPTN